MVVIKPVRTSLYSFKAFAIGARQLVVQEAPEMMLSSALSISWFTPYTICLLYTSHYRNLSAHFIQPIGKRKLSAGKVTVTVYLLLKNVLDKGYTLYSNRISCSKSSFLENFFVLPRLAWHILGCDFTLFPIKKPHPFCQKGWENAKFF